MRLRLLTFLRAFTFAVLVMQGRGGTPAAETRDGGAALLPPKTHEEKPATLPYGRMSALRFDLCGDLRLRWGGILIRSRKQVRRVQILDALSM